MTAQAPPSNATEWTVSELAGALKRTLEDSFGHVRLRGEISSFRGRHSSGHCYFCLKDENARVEAVIWKTAFNRLKFKPEEGLEVIATGRITTFPGKSTYQIVVENLEPAGVGALMALLEERKRKLAAEGLFEAGRKRRLPFLPATIGVVTSPTGSVIRDILHRLADRFPRQVLVWPVRVQGETSAEEVTAAIRGFNALGAGPIPRPDVLIVARGGGSLEDLWGFNEEIVVRAAAESAIPLVSAVGHETDTTLIDHAADRRAPTPTAAAEMVVPVWADLLRNVSELGGRQRACMLKGLEHRRTALRSAARALPGPDALLGPQRQRLDLATARLKPALARLARIDETKLAALAQGLARHSPVALLREAAARLKAWGRDRPEAAFRRQLDVKRERLPRMAERLQQAFAIQRTRREERLGVAGQLLESFSYKSVLERGFALVRGGDGKPIRRAAGIGAGEALAIEFADGTARAVAEGAPKPKRKTPAAPKQGTLFDA